MEQERINSAAGIHKRLLLSADLETMNYYEEEYSEVESAQMKVRNGSSYLVHTSK